MRSEQILDQIRDQIQESIQVKQALLKNADLLRNIQILAQEMICCIKSGGKLVLCGNGGSASDALHFAGEIVGRFQRDRAAWPAMVLNADVATMTAIANDYGFSELFARQAEAHVNPGDVFIGISTSGNSENVCRAAAVARQKGAATAALLGRDGGRLAQTVDYPIIIPCDITARTQECHITIIHILCGLAEDGMTAAEAE